MSYIFFTSSNELVFWFLKLNWDAEISLFGFMLNCSMWKVCCQVGHFKSLKTIRYSITLNQNSFFLLAFITDLIFKKQWKYRSWNFQAVQRQVSEFLLPITSVLRQFPSGWRHGWGPGLNPTGPAKKSLWAEE